MSDSVTDVCLPHNDRWSTLSLSKGVIRAVTIFSLLLYALSLHAAHIYYLNPRWEYLGFTFHEPDLLEYLFAGVLIALAGCVVPVRFGRPSSVFAIVLLLVVYIPTIVITIALQADTLSSYGLALTCLALAFAMACAVSRLRIDAASVRDSFPSQRMVILLMLAWLLASVALIIRFGDVMALVGFDKVYEQRALARSPDVVYAYLQTYYLNVLCPALLAVGLTHRGLRILVAFAAAGFLLVYAVSAQKMALIFPIAIMGFNIVLCSKSKVLSLTSFAAAVLALGTVIATMTSVEIDASNWFAALLVHRTIAIPGLTFSQYSDVFNNLGWTHWAHVRMISQIMPPSVLLLEQPGWPSLGYIVGRAEYHDVTLNLNANLFSSDGLAAGGPVGVVAIGALLAIWLWILDRVTCGWNQRFVLLVLLPIAVSLANGPFFTVLLSFGGMFWTAVFGAYSRYRLLDDEVRGVDAT